MRAKVGRMVARSLLGMLLGLTWASPVVSYPAFQKFSQTHSGRTVSCAMCHVNPQGPSGQAEGQLLSLSAAELERVDAARDASSPGVDVDSPIMNRFGNHVIKTLGMDKVNEAIGDPELLAKGLDKTDIDGDGISDGKEFLDGTDPLSKFNGDPNLLFWINLSRQRFEILYVALAIGLIFFGLSCFTKRRQETE